MRRLQFGPPPGPRASLNDKVDYCLRSLQEIERGSFEETVTEMGTLFEPTNDTHTFALDPTTATAEDVGNVLATLLRTLAKGGPKKNR